VIGTLTQPDLLACSAAILGARTLQAAKTRITKSRISAITDEIGPAQADAIAFAKQFGLQWVELRNVPGTKKEFAFLSEPELKRYAAELAANKIKSSLLKTSLLKSSPGRGKEAIGRDGYQGEISLATEIFDGTFDKANDAMREVMHIVGELS
jgi:hypothetical protein